jgi:aliphatic nitrilase
MTGSTARTVRLAAIQAAPVYLDKAATISKACDLIAEAGARGIDIAGFPENFVPGHPLWYYYYPNTSPYSMDMAVRLFNNAVVVPSVDTDILCQAAADANTYVVIGITERNAKSTGTLYNTQLHIDRHGNILGKHQKLVPTIGERIVHAPGRPETLGCVLSEHGPISGMLCSENANPLALSALASEYPTVHVASWPNHFMPDWGDYGMPEISLMVSQAVAYISKAYVISVCGTISPEMVDMAPTEEQRKWLRETSQTGGSAILSAEGGRVVAGPLAGNVEGIVQADVDLDVAVRNKILHDTVGHYNRPDIFELTVRKDPQPLVSIRSPSEAGTVNATGKTPSYGNAESVAEARGPAAKAADQ